MHSRGLVGRRSAALAVAVLATGCVGASPEQRLGSTATTQAPVPTVAAAEPLRSQPVRRSSSAGPARGTPARPGSPANTGQPGVPTRPIGSRLGPVQRPAGPQCEGPGWEQRRGTAMLAEIDYPYWGLSFTIRFLAARDGYLGYTSYPDRLIVIFVRPCSQESDVTLRHTIAHEIGHAVDYALADDTRRARWKRLRGIAGSTPWYGCSACTDYGTPAGDFAETFAYWQAGPGGFRSTLAGPPSAAQLRTLNPLFWP